MEILSSIDSKVSPEAFDIQSLVERFVDDCLNERSLGAVDEIFSSKFYDHDPLRFPPLYEPSQINAGTLDDLVSLVRFLEGDTVDFFFTLEDVIPQQERCGYRIFGQGDFRTLTAGGYGSTPLSSIMPPMESMMGTQSGNVHFDDRQNAPEWGVLRQSSRTVADRLTMTIECVGIFHARGGKLFERWGTWLLG